MPVCVTGTGLHRIAADATDNVLTGAAGCTVSTGVSSGGVGRARACV